MKRLTAALTLAAAAWPQIAGAATPAGLTISPIYQQVELAEGQTSAHSIVTVTNNSPVTQTFKFEVSDFGSLDESGGVAFLGESSNDFVKAHGLAKWVTLDQTSATIAAGGKVDIGMTITNDQALAPGGHYAALEAEAQTAPTDAGSRSRVGITQVLSSLLLLLKDGSPPPNLDLVAQGLGGGGLWSLPTSASERFLDEGAVHVVPRGTVAVKDALGRQVMSGALNEDSGIILPSSFRRYQTPLMQLAAAWLPGRYTVTTVYRYDGTTKTKAASYQFWYAGAWWVWAAVVLVLALGGGAAWWVWWRPRRRGRKR